MWEELPAGRSSSSLKPEGGSSGFSFYYCMVETFSTFLELSGCWIRMKKLVDQERELKELNGFLLSFEKEMELDGN